MVQFALSLVLSFSLVSMVLVCTLLQKCPFFCLRIHDKWFTAEAQHCIFVLMPLAEIDDVVSVFCCVFVLCVGSLHQMMELTVILQKRIFFLWDDLACLALPPDISTWVVMKESIASHETVSRWTFGFVQGVHHLLRRLVAVITMGHHDVLNFPSMRSALSDTNAMVLYHLHSFTDRICEVVIFDHPNEHCRKMDIGEVQTRTALFHLWR